LNFFCSREGREEDEGKKPFPSQPSRPSRDIFLLQNCVVAKTAVAVHFCEPEMNREALNRFFERGILALVLVILVFAPLAMGAVDAWEFLVVQGLTMGVMLLWALRIWAGPKPKLLWPPICWIVLAFAVYAVARYFTADIEYVARLEMIQTLMYAFLFFAIVNNLHRQEFSQVISFTMIFLAAGISCFAVYQFLTHSNRVWDLVSPYGGRASGTYISPNDFSCLLEMLLPLDIAYLLAGRLKPLARIFLGYAALAMIAGLAVTFSRGGWVAAAVGLLAVLGILICHRNHRLPALLLAILLLVGGTIFVSKYLSQTHSYIERVEKVEQSHQLNLQIRLDLWSAAEKMWLDHFWWGVGPAHFDYRFRQYRPEIVQARPGHVHNDYLNLLTDWGTVGGIIVLVGMIAFAAGLAKTWKYVRAPENTLDRRMSNRFAFFLGAMAGLLALAAHSFVDFNLHIPANAILGVTLLALLSGNLRLATERYWFNARIPMKFFATVALAAGIFYLGHEESRRAGEQSWLARAERLPDFSPERAAALKKAFTAEPQNFETAYDIGECYRMESFNGAENYEALAKTAMDWYERGWKLDRFDGYDYLRYGMCDDWLGKHDEAEKFFNQAAALDPNGYFTAANVGWHYVQAGDYAAARSWLERSLRVQGQDNEIARSYLQIVEQKMTEDASGKNPLPPGF
jgi:O-antigen ligase